MTEQIILIAIIQGITEFLPISSSGHLNLVHGLSGFDDQGLAMDVAVHVGTVLAVILYNPGHQSDDHQRPNHGQKLPR